MLEAAYFSEMSVGLRRTKRCQIPEDRILLLEYGQLEEEEDDDITLDVREIDYKTGT
jgi:hypothetical protein